MVCAEPPPVIQAVQNSLEKRKGSFFSLREIKEEVDRTLNPLQRTSESTI